MIYADAPALCTVCVLVLEVPDTVASIAIRDSGERPCCLHCGHRIGPRGEHLPDDQP